MADFSKTKPSENFEDRTGDTPWNSFDKFMVELLLGLGVVKDLNKVKADNEKMQRENEEYTRQQREEYYRKYGNPSQKANLPPPPKQAPIFPELEAILKKLR